MIPWQRITVSIEDGPSFPAYTHGHLWNGWECPAFELETAQKVLAWLCAEDPGRTWHYDPETATLHYGERGEEPWSWTGEAALLDGSSELCVVFAVGAWEWCWSKSE